MLKIVCDAEGCVNEAEIEFEQHLPPRWVKMEFQVPDKPVAAVEEDSDDDSNGGDDDADQIDLADPYSRGFMSGRGASLRRPPHIGPHTHAHAVICPNHDMPAVKGKVLSAARRRIGYMIGA